MIWILAEPRALARCVRPAEVGAALPLPAAVNGLDVLRTSGPEALVEHLYRLVAARGWHYDVAPFDPQPEVRQRVRALAEIERERRATCLDLTVLLAGLLLHHDLLPTIVCVQGHAWLGYARTRTRRTTVLAQGFGTWSRGLIDELDALRGLDPHWAYLECTGAADTTVLTGTFPESRGRDRTGRMSFARATAAGAEHLARHVHGGHGALAHDHRRFLFALEVHELQVKHAMEPDMTDPDEAEKSAKASEGGISISAGQDVTVRGDVVGRDKITTTTIGAGSTVALGPGSHAESVLGSTLADLHTFFESLQAKIQARPDDQVVDRDELQDTVTRINQETAKGEAANESKLERWVKALAQMAPDIFDVVVAAMAGPLSAASVILRKVVERAG